VSWHCEFCGDGATVSRYRGKRACERCHGAFREAGLLPDRPSTLCGKCRRPLGTARPWDRAPRCRCHVVRPNPPPPKDWRTDNRPLWQRALERREREKKTLAMLA